MNVGILALQGAVREHSRAVERCGAKAFLIKKAQDLENLDALIIPGGESTTIGKLMVEYELVEPIRRLAKEGLPIFGTCAGLILLAKKITEGNQPLLDLMDIEAQRNAFGRQSESFEEDLKIPVLGEELFRGVFIRAPLIKKAGSEVKALAQINGDIVLVEQDNFLASAFHPELTDDLRMHEYFIKKQPFTKFVQGC